MRTISQPRGKAGEGVGRCCRSRQRITIGSAKAVEVVGTVANLAVAPVAGHRHWHEKSGACRGDFAGLLRKGDTMEREMKLQSREGELTACEATELPDP